MTKLIEYHKEQGIHIHLFKGLFNIYAEKERLFPKEMYAVVQIPVFQSHYMKAKFGCWLLWKNWFQLGFSFFNCGVSIKMLGLYFSFQFNRKEKLSKADFNALISIGDDYVKFDAGSGSLVIVEDKDPPMIPNTKYRPAIYKDFYISKYLKIYTEWLLNEDMERILEVALPNLYYLSIAYSKSGDILGFGVNLANSSFCDISILSREITFSCGKNYLSRNSNLFSCASIDRYFALKGNKINPQDKNAENLCFTILKAHNKYAQFKHLMKYLDVGLFFKNPRNWHFGWNIYESRGLDQFIADLGIKYGIFKDRTGTITPNKEAEDALIKDRIKAWRDKLLKKEVQNG